MYALKVETGKSTCEHLFFVIPVCNELFHLTYKFYQLLGSFPHSAFDRLYEAVDLPGTLKAFDLHPQRSICSYGTFFYYLILHVTDLVLRFSGVWPRSHTRRWQDQTTALVAGSMLFHSSTQ